MSRFELVSPELIGALLPSPNLRKGTHGSAKTPSYMLGYADVNMFAVDWNDIEDSQGISDKGRGLYCEPNENSIKIASH